MCDNYLFLFLLLFRNSIGMFDVSNGDCGRGGTENGIGTVGPA